MDGTSPEVDKDPRTLYFQQITNGLHIRMALLKMLLPPGPSAHSLKASDACDGRTLPSPPRAGTIRARVSRD